MRKELVTGRSGSSAPARSSASTPSLIISDQTRRFRRPDIMVAATVGISPMPSCSVDPSSANRATRSADQTRDVVGGPGDGRHQRRIDLERPVNQARAGFLRPRACTACSGFIWAITRPPRARACSMAAGRMLTSIPRETLPARAMKCGSAPRRPVVPC